jgi:hypothetical protein
MASMKPEFKPQYCRKKKGDKTTHKVAVFPSHWNYVITASKPNPAEMSLQNLGFKAPNSIITSFGFGGTGD